MATDPIIIAALVAAALALFERRYIRRARRWLRDAIDLAAVVTMVLALLRSSAT